jgi:hypothetical protein
MGRGGTETLRAAARAGVLVVGAACAPAPPHLGGPRPLASASASASGSSATQPPAPAVAPAALLELAALDDGGAWPPSPIAPAIDASEPGEGEWTPVEPPWMHKLPGAPAALYRTFVRSDRAKPKARILLVEMDARQLDFDVEPGVEDPRFVVGGKVKKEGRLPRTKEVATRVVAAWNGGFRSEHGFYGVMMKKHVFIPPVPNAAVAVVMDDGRFGFGTWGPSKEIDRDILSFRQNLDPLLADGVINPRGRPRWGGTMGSDQTKRSAMCLTHTRHVIYGWGNDVGFATLAKGLQLAGCQYAMHLDMNPIHTGFLFMSFEDEQYRKGKTDVLTLQMGGIYKRFVEPNAKDFFYAMVRDVAHPTAMRTSKLSGNVAWTPDEGAQPPPAWSPSVWHGHAGDLDLTLFERDRVGFALRLGELEHGALGALGEDAREQATTLRGEPAAHTIATVDLGAATRTRALGVTIEGVMASPANPAAATLVIDAHGALTIALPGAAIEAQSLAQGPLLVRGGVPVEGLASPDASEVRARVGLGLTPEGHLVIARGRASEATLAAALVDAGAVVALGDRGQGTPALERAAAAAAATGAKLWSRHPGTTLFVLARAMSPRAFRWDRDAEGAPRWPEWKSPIP